MCLQLALPLQRFFCVLLAAVTVLLAGCQTAPEEPGSPSQVLRYLWTRDEQIGALDPRVEYMRIEVNGRKTLLGLQERLYTPSLHGLDVDEYWYSSQREMLHLRNGRIHVVLGTSTQWVSNRSRPPAWAQVQAAPQAVHWLRLRDEQPHARSGLAEPVSTSRAQAPAHGVNVAQGTELHWYADEVHAVGQDGRTWHHTQWFGVTKDGVVIHSEQCIAPDLCLRLQRMPRP